MDGVPTVSYATGQFLEAIVDGTRDPYTVRFATTGDALATEVTYTIPVTAVLDARQPKLPTMFLPRRLGPQRIRGSYVALAFDAAYHYRERHRPLASQAFAPLDGDTSWAFFSTTTHNHGDYFVTMRYFDPRLRLIGCDVQQNYDVDWRTFQVSTIKGCWPP